MDHKGLTRAYLRDQLADIRTARKYQTDYPQYAENNREIERQAIVEFRRVWKNRTKAKIGSYGIPKAEGRE